MSRARGVSHWLSKSFLLLPAAGFLAGNEKRLTLGSLASFQFSRFHHAAKCCRDRGERIGFVGTEIESGLKKHVPHAPNCIAAIGVILENFSCRICQRSRAGRRFPNSIINIFLPTRLVLVRDHVERGIHKLPELHQFDINLLALFVKGAESLERVSDELFVIRLSHATKYETLSHACQVAKEAIFHAILRAVPGAVVYSRISDEEQGRRNAANIRERYLNHILSASADCGKLGA